MAARIGFPAIGKVPQATRDVQTAIDNIRERMQTLESAHTTVSELQSGIATQQNTSNAAKFADLQSQIDALEASVTPYSSMIGDGSASSFTVTHGFGTKNVQVSVIRSSSPYDEILVDVDRSSANAALIKFDFIPTVNEFTVVIAP